MLEPRLVTTFRTLAFDLEAIGASWALVGGLAVSARAEPRTTRDIDVAIAVTTDTHAEETVVRLRQRGYQEQVVMNHRHVDRLATVRCTHPENEGVFCDLLFATAGIEAEVVQQAEPLEVLPALTVPVARTGHLLALKTLALRVDRPIDRPQDFSDVRELLERADAQELRRAREALELITERGFHRGKDLLQIFMQQERDVLGSGDHGPFQVVE